MVRAIFMLATKYDIQYIADEAIARLKICFPTTLKRFEESTCFRNSILKGPLYLQPTDSIAVVSLARTFNLPFLLPTAFYQCCQLPASAVLNGINYGREIVRLSQHDLQLYVDGRAALISHNYSRLSHLTGTAHCEDNCEPPLRTIASHALRDKKITGAASFDSVDAWLNQYQDEEEKQDLCVACKRAMERRLREDKHAMWKGLGALFDVKPWPLEEEDDEGDECDESEDDG